MKKAFVTIFPPFEKMHAFKDVGIIPKIMADNFGYKSFIFCDENIPLDERYFSKVKLITLKSKKNRTTNSGSYGIFNVLNKIKNLSKDNDEVIINFYHYKIKHFFLAALSKIIFKNVFIYIKLDLNSTDRAIQFEPKNKIKKIVRNFIIKNIDFFTVETVNVFNSLKVSKPFLNKIYYLPNGFFLPEDERLNPDFFDKMISDKENCILFSARLDAFQKNTCLMINSFLKSNLWRNGWTLKLSGETENDIIYFVDSEQKDIFNLAAKSKISLLGHLDRKELYQQMQTAKIFSLSSRYESFGLVLTEAAANGCVLVGTNVGAMSDITQNGKLGYLVDKHTVDVFSESLVSAANNQNLIDLARQQMEYALSNFDWVNICNNLAKIINEKTK